MSNNHMENFVVNYSEVVRDKVREIVRIEVVHEEVHEVVSICMIRAALGPGLVFFKYFDFFDPNLNPNRLGLRLGLGLGLRYTENCYQGSKAATETRNLNSETMKSMRYTRRVDDTRI